MIRVGYGCTKVYLLYYLSPGAAPNRTVPTRVGRSGTPNRAKPDAPVAGPPSRRSYSATYWRAGSPTSRPRGCVGSHLRAVVDVRQPSGLPWGAAPTVHVLVGRLAPFFLRHGQSADVSGLLSLNAYLQGHCVPPGPRLYTKHCVGHDPVKSYPHAEPTYHTPKSPTTQRHEHHHEHEHPIPSSEPQIFQWASS